MSINVNCKDCDYCFAYCIDWNDEDNPEVIFKCSVYGSVVDFVNNIDCICFEPNRPTIAE